MRNTPDTHGKKNNTTDINTSTFQMKKKTPSSAKVRLGALELDIYSCISLGLDQQNQDMFMVKGTVK